MIVDPVLLFQVNPDHYAFISFRITQCPTQCCRRRKALGRLPSWGSDARSVLTSSLGSSLDLPSTPKPQTSPHTFGQAVLSSRSQAINTPDGRWLSASQRAPSPAEGRRLLWQKEHPEEQDAHSCYFRARSLLLFMTLDQTSSMQSNRSYFWCHCFFSGMRSPSISRQRSCTLRLKKQVLPKTRAAGKI